MKNKQLYRETFSQVRFRGEVLPEEMPERKTGRPVIRRAVLLAAAICLLTALGVTAGATGMFGLRDLVIRQPQTVVLPDGTESTEEISTGSISLSGWMDAPESRALAEWKTWLASYDDGGALERIGNNPTGFEEEYGMYLVYTREMADKLDEIAAKYGLALHKWLAEVPGNRWSDAVGTAFLPENAVGYYGYMYEDGSFHFDGDYAPSEERTMTFQFGRWVRGSFHDISLNVADESLYRQWHYPTACGVTVTLAISSFKGLVVADLEDSFVVINVLEGTETGYLGSEAGITAETLEKFADGIDFTALSPVRPPENEPPQLPQEDTLYFATGITEQQAQEFYCRFVQAVEEDRRLDAAAMIGWPRTVVTPAGEVTVSTAEEFLPYYEDIFTEDLREAIMIHQYTRERADLFHHDGMVAGAGGDIWFALKPNGLEVLTVHVPATQLGIRGTSCAITAGDAP